MIPSRPEQDRPPRRHVPLLPALAALLLGLFPTSATAQSGGPWAIVSSTLDGGGLQGAGGGGFMLKGTAGQPDAGVLSGGAFRLDGGFWRRGLQVVDAPLPPPMVITRFAVHPAYPNPTRSGCAMAFDLPGERLATVQVFDVHGRLVRSLLDGERPAGRHLVQWDGADASGAAASQGLYFIRVRAGADLGHSRVVRMGDRGGNR